MSKDKIDERLLLDLTAKIMAAYARDDHIELSNLPEAISNVHNALNDAHIGKENSAPASLRKLGTASHFFERRSNEELWSTKTPLAEIKTPGPAVLVKNSITNEYLICLEDGAKMKRLSYYLKTKYGMTPSDYRAKWGLLPEYPMVAPAYAKKPGDKSSE